jgi:hypothetical protein
MEPCFYAYQQVSGRIGPTRTESESEVEQVCDELWNADCRQKIADTEASEFRVRGDSGSWSPWGVRHP